MSTFLHENIQVGRHGLSRRSFLHQVSAGTVAAGTLSFQDLMSLQAEELRRQNRAVILLWMAGGPSQFETFDPKPGHANGGPTQAIRTSVSGIEIAQDWTRTAKVMNDIALLRSLTNKEGSHQRATYQMHTGYIPSGSVKHPSLAANIAAQVADPKFDLPAVVSVGRTVGSGFLGVDYEPFNVDQAGQLPANVASPVTDSRYTRRLGLLGRLEGEFAAKGGKTVVQNHSGLYAKSAKMVLSPKIDAFEFKGEPQSLIASYGNTGFGRGCLLARRLVETGVTFVEVRSNGWDTHQDVFENVANKANEVDPAFSTLISDLKSRGMLDRTLVVWMGEFGRTPRVNPRTGRDHYPRVFNGAMAGGGVKGGQVIGASTADGSAIKDSPVTVADLFCSICKSISVDP
ncbi:MAG: DUF1501 domain-containing protein, partial [Planctomycetota bacterium]|nr:DUF1501 domain-containing protein [Planctomycetota bacterium]